MDFRLVAAVLASKTLKGIIRVFGGGGTAAPGLLAEYIDPLALKKLSKFYQPTILVTGTNGKTTTSRLLGSLLNEAKVQYIHNRSGSNLLRGLIGTLIDDVQISLKRNKVALLEVDEATLPYVISQTNPKIIIFNNLFRDQLDRYGEVEKIRKTWLKSLLHLESSSVLILNSDDHSVSHLAEKTKAEAVFFGIEDDSVSIGKLPHASDFTSCINCGADLKFEGIYMAHLGKYKCTNCNLKRPQPDVYAKKVYLLRTDGFLADIATPKGDIKVKVSLPGLYNVYNCLATISAALALGLDLSLIKRGLEFAKPAFGRTEKIQIGGKSIFIGLVKNPAGFNEILRTIFKDDAKKYILIAINDKIADGRDVSWLWDVDFEHFVKKIARLWISGLRARDMALRIKYTGFYLPFKINPNIQEALENAIDILPDGQTLYVLPNYTAMLSLKKNLAKLGISKFFWQD